MPDLPTIADVPAWYWAGGLLVAAYAVISARIVWIVLEFWWYWNDYDFKFKAWRAGR